VIALLDQRGGRVLAELGNPGALRRVDIGVVVVVIQRDDRLALGGGQAQLESPLSVRAELASAQR
jgi:hypothetical protein